MSLVFNVYCDESCHLENDPHQVMVLGGIWCPSDKAQEIARRLREIKAKHLLPKDFEVKWTKVSPGKLSVYLDWIDYFFDDDDLHFRGLIVPDKRRLRHEEFGQTHDTWYYKMYFVMLNAIINPRCRYRIYLDLKDTRGASKVRKLQEVLSNAQYDFSNRILELVQCVRSEEVEQIQLADLITGAISRINRGIDGSSAKQDVVNRIRKRSGSMLTRSTFLREEKVNLFRWTPQEQF